MSGWKLTWKRIHAGGPPAWIDGSVLCPDLLAELPHDRLMDTRLRVGQRELRLDDVFEAAPLAEDGGPMRMAIEGSHRFVRLGAGTRAGVLEVDGDGGDLLGAGLEGGEVRVKGSVGVLAGAGMKGGMLRIEGDAGDRLGGPLHGEAAGMGGGEILVAGNAGAEAGARMRRGLIAIAGSAGELPGHHLIAGTVLVVQGDLAFPGIEMRRGTVIGLGSLRPPGVGFRRDGPVEPTWLRILGRRLEDLGFGPAARSAWLSWLSPPLESWSGDRLSLGHGEVLVRGAAL
ncbi:MAG TPA: formylmethanofuran dehydrogenase subunit C [Planctomycetota bacterium]|nr:formylmethanofuran dehydrogenase subunit C [Planctomycetota bacterium]